MNILRTTLLALFVMVALLAVACGDSEDAAVVEPTPVPTVAPPPTPEPTPVPPTPTPEPVMVPADSTDGAGTAPAAGSMTFNVPNFGPETTGMDVAEALLSAEEIACVQSTLGPEASAALLAANVLDPAAAGSTEVFGECLTQENSVTLFLAGLQGVAGGTLSEETLNCAGNAVAPYHTVLFAAETPPEVTFGVLPCLSPEEMEALMSAAQQ